MTTELSGFTLGYQVIFLGTSAAKMPEVAKRQGLPRMGGRANRANVTRAH